MTTSSPSKLKELFDSVEILANTFRRRFDVSYIQRSGVVKKQSFKWRVCVDGQRFLDKDISVALKSAIKHVYEKYHKEENTRPED